MALNWYNIIFSFFGYSIFEFFNKISDLPQYKEVCDIILKKELGFPQHDCLSLFQTISLSSFREPRKIKIIK